MSMRFQRWKLPRVPKLGDSRAGFLKQLKAVGLGTLPGGGGDSGR